MTRRELRPSAYPLPLLPMSEDDRLFFALRAGERPRVSWIKRVLGGGRG